MRLFARMRSALALIIGAVCLCALSTSGMAQAIVDTPVLNPSTPLAGQTVHVELHGTPCVFYFSGPDNPPVVTRNGNAVRLVVQAYVSSDPDFCIYPTFTLPFSIGAYGPGSYSVQVDAQYQEFLGGTITQTLGILAFVVSSPKPVPALNRLMLVLLALFIGGAVWNVAKRGKLSSMS